MKVRISESFNPGEPQQPLPVGSTPEPRPKRAKRRRSRSRKPGLVERKTTSDHGTVETRIRQNEVRLIWDREDAQAAEAKAKQAASQKERPAADRTASEKTEAAKNLEPPKKPKTPAEKPHAANTEESMESTPEAFHAMLDDLVKDRAADEAALENARKTAESAQPPLQDAAKNAEVPFGAPPALPPEPTSYRHFFWHEPTVTSPAAAMAERSMLPSVNSGETPPAQSDARPYVEAQSAPAAERPSAAPWPRQEAVPQPVATPEMPAQPPQPEQSVRSHEVESSQPPLEAVPLHTAKTLQFPERMPDARKPSPEAFQNAIPGVRAEAAPVQASAEQPLGHTEIMALADKIKVDGVSLSEMLAAHRIDEAGLRAVVQTFLRGGDVRKQLTQEIINYEKGFERDPVARHRSGRPVRTAALAAKVAQKGYELTRTSQKAAGHAGRALKGAARMAREELRGTGFAANWPSIAAIAVIYSLIIILLLS